MIEMCITAKSITQFQQMSHELLVMAFWFVAQVVGVNGRYEYGRF